MRAFLLSGAAIAVLAPLSALAQTSQSDANPPVGNDKPTDIVVIAKRLDAARESIKPSLGASTYTLTEQAIQNLPGSDNQPLDQIILQMPGVSQDQFGQFHIRDEHNGVQYRLNGVILPESIAVFGQVLSPRLIKRMDLVTGTLPAQYGLRTAGILDITTKSGLENTSTVSLYGGSHGTIEPNVQIAGSSGGTTYFASGDYKRSNLGIENVDGSKNALHDRTNQFNGFGYIDHIIGPDDRIAFTGGYGNQHYQIPNPRGQVGSQIDANGNPVAVNGVTSYPSEALNEQQLQVYGFGALSWLHSAGAFSTQTSVFGRIANLDYRPDYTGELLFNGQAQYASKRDITFGLQFDSAYKLNDRHTLRGGLLFQQDKARSFTNTAVFPTDGDVYDPTLPLNGYSPGNINGAPELLPYLINTTQRTYTAYVQDEWHVVPSFVVNFGARFDENDGPRKERQLSPRINLVWNPDPDLTVHAGYARYFSPAPFEIISNTNVGQTFNTTSTPNVRTNDAPYAQRENYFDAGVLQKLGHLTVGIDGYYRKLTHLVDEGQFGAPIVLTPFNYEKGRVVGAELSLLYNNGGFNAYGNAAYQKEQGRNIISSQFNFAASDLAYIADHYIYTDHNQTWTASAGASYRWHDGLLAGSRLSADMIYGSGVRTGGPTLPDGSSVPNGGSVPAYATFNLSAGHNFAASGFDVHVDVQNLFDRVYELRDGSGIGVGAPSFGARRGFFVGIAKTF